MSAWCGIELGNCHYKEAKHALASRGIHDYGGALRGPMTAHPKVDAETGALHAFGYGIGGFGSKRMAAAYPRLDERYAGLPHRYRSA